MKNAELIAIPLGTRLTAVALVEGEVHVWMATRDKSLPYERWEGTYLRIEPNERVTRVTYDTQNVQELDELEVKPARDGRITLNAVAYGDMLNRRTSVEGVLRKIANGKRSNTLTAEEALQLANELSVPTGFGKQGTD